MKAGLLAAVVAAVATSGFLATACTPAPPPPPPPSPAPLIDAADDTVNQVGQRQLQREQDVLDALDGR